MNNHLKEIEELRRHLRDLEQELASYAGIYGYTAKAKELFERSPVSGAAKDSQPHVMN